MSPKPTRNPRSTRSAKAAKAPKKAPPRRSSGPALDRGGVPSVAPIVDATLRGARGMANTIDPLDIEIFVSGIIGMLDMPLIDVPDPVAFMGVRFADLLGKRRSPDAFALLLGLAALAPEPVAEAARAGVRLNRARRLPEPVWSTMVGRTRFIEAWFSNDVYGDQDSILATYDYDGRRPHTLAFLVDHNLGGLLKDAFISDDPAETLAVWNEDMGPRSRPIDEAELAARIHAALDAYDETFDPPSTEMVPDLAALVRARLRSAPSGDPVFVADWAEPDVEALLADFVASPEAAGLAAPDVAHHLISFAGSDGDPLRWSPNVVLICLAGELPAHAILDADEIEAMADTTRAWVRYAGRRTGLPADAIEDTVAAVAEVEPEFRAAMADPRRAGPAKALFGAMLGEGIDPGDEAAVGGWLEAFNRRSPDDRETILGLGPGDPLSTAPGPRRHPAPGSDIGLDAEARRAWLFPPLDAAPLGLDPSLLDPGDPDDRAILIEAEHPELAEAIDEDLDMIDADGAPVSPRLHLLVHEIVASQILDDDPPAVWQEARALIEAGVDRHEILHRLAEGAIHEVWRGLHRGEARRSAPKSSRRPRR